MKKIKKMSVVALSLTLVMAGAQGVFAKTNEVSSAPQIEIVSNAELVREYKILTLEEKEILIKAYDELDKIQIEIEKIQKHEGNFTRAQEDELERLIKQMEAIYGRIEPIETKVMNEYFKDTDFGGNCGPMADDDEYYIGDSEEYINSLAVLTEGEKASLIAAYDKIESLYKEYDAMEESQLESPRALEILKEVENIIINNSDLEDKIATNEIKNDGDSLESAIKFVDEMKLDESSKAELRKLYKEVFDLYTELEVLYGRTDIDVTSKEFIDIDEGIELKLIKIYDRIIELEARAN